MYDKKIGWLLIGVIVGGFISALLYINGFEDTTTILGYLVLHLSICVILTYAIILIIDAKQKDRD